MVKPGGEKKEKWTNIIRFSHNDTLFLTSESYNVFSFIIIFGFALETFQKCILWHEFCNDMKFYSNLEEKKIICIHYYMYIYFSFKFQES